MKELSLPSAHDPFVAGVRRTILDGALIARGDRVLVACSGGADSVGLLVCLAAAACHEGFSIEVGHVDHRLRGAGSSADAGFVRGLAAALGLRFHLGTADVTAVRADRGGSIEEVARWARMSLLESMMSASGCGIVATAHHQDDLAETVLMRCIRGAGLTGLGAMSEGIGRSVVRPFLGLRREDVRAAVVRWGLSWREDESNSSEDVTRNRVRHTLLPLLSREWNPRIVPALARLAEVAASDNAALDEWTGHVWRCVCRYADEQRVVLDGSGLSAYPLGVRRRIVRFGAHNLRTVSGTLSYAETERVVALVQKKGVVKLRARMSAWSDMREVWLEASDCWQGPAEAHIGTETDVPGWGSLHVCEVSDPSASSALPDGELLCPLNDLALPIAIRRWQPGDRIVTEMDRPAGRKVADLARRMTAPVDPRAVLVVTDAGRIIWAIGVARVAMPDEAVAETPYVSMSFVGCMNDDQRDSIGV